MNIEFRFDGSFHAAGMVRMATEKTTNIPAGCQ